jgi:hypothetical protein
MLIDDFKLLRWRIAAVPRFSSQVFAYRYVIIPAANIVRIKSPTPTLIKARLKRAHIFWFRRVKELISRDLWLPSPAVNSLQSQQASIKRCLYCRPTSITYKWPNGEPNIRLCGRHSFCPFCAARNAEDVYRRVSRFIRKQQNKKKGLVATCRIATYFLPAKDFDAAGWTDENVLAYTKELRILLTAEIAKYKKIRRQLKTHTAGSLWRVVLNPADNGWEVQIRQLFISRPNAKRPVNRAKKSAAIFLQSAKIADFKASMAVLGAFVKYPTGLLLGYVELTAAALNARDGLRLSNGTGCLYRRGRVKKAKEETPDPLPFIP